MTTPLSEIETFMLKAENGFTYGELVLKFSPKEAETRLCDRTIQKARRKGWIAFQREGARTVWRPTNEGRAALA